MPEIDAAAVTASYLDSVTELMRRVQNEEKRSIEMAAGKLAEQIAADRLVHVYGPVAIPISLARRSSFVQAV